MASSLFGSSLTKELDLRPDQFTYLLDLAATLKRDRKSGTEKPMLTRKTIALLFEKTSTRTRAAFETAANHQGAAVTVFDPQSSQIGHKESIADTAIVLSRMYDAIMYRGTAQETVEELAKYATVPVYNALTDSWHPTQMLADCLTMQEHSLKPLNEIKFTYVGDARNNMGNSLLITAAMMGMSFSIGAPKSLWPDQELITKAQALAKANGGEILLTESATEAVADSEFVHTDIWVSMGEPESAWKERIDLLKPYRVNAKLMLSAAPTAKFMHCLPALHDLATTTGKKAAKILGVNDGIEVSSEVFDSTANIAFDQAENRLHTIKALLVATLVAP
jgi:ornithine carbamoyltransferase